MNREFSDSLFPFGIGASFIITLLALLLGGLFAGVFLGPFLTQNGFENGGGIVLLIIVLVIMVGPNIYNKRVSRFEKGRSSLKSIDYLGMVQGLRGTFIRLLLYEDGLEIRAFYHRYYIPFEEIVGVEIERIFFFDQRINIKTTIPGVPEFLTLPEKEISKVIPIIHLKTGYDKSNSTDENNRTAD